MFGRVTLSREEIFVSSKVMLAGVLASLMRVNVEEVVESSLKITSLFDEYMSYFAAAGFNTRSIVKMSAEMIILFFINL